MLRAIAAPVLAGCVLFASLAALPAADFSSQAQQRVLYAGLVQRDGDVAVRDAGPASFVIREDGRQREILRVEPATSPMAVAVIVDNSQPAEPTIADLRRALEAFFAGIDGLGPAALVTVADRPTIVADYTRTQKTLQDAARRVFHGPNSGATLLDAIRDTARGLRRRDEDRATIVVVTTEHIEFSQLHYRDVLEALADSGAMLHAVVLRNPDAPLLSDEARNRATVLDRGPRESGGMRRDVLTSLSYEPVLKALADSLRHQYRVTYARPEALIPPEKITVSAAQPGVEAYGAPARGQAAK